MVKQNKTVFVVSIVCLFILIGIIVYKPNIHYYPHVNSIHVINLDKSISRWENIQKSAKSIDMEIVRFPAVNGKELSAADMNKQGIGFTMTNPERKDPNQSRRNLGVVGCYLSHRNLLTYLSTLDVPDYYGHLILEDDVNIPHNFLKPDDEWHKVYTQIPQDWDIVYLSISNPYGYKINPHVMRLQHSYDKLGNWGAYAYLVKHGSIRTKILPWLKYMVDPIDEQYYIKFNEWNVYAVTNEIIGLNEELNSKSTILMKD